MRAWRLNKMVGQKECEERRYKAQVREMQRYFRLKKTISNSVPDSRHTFRALTRARLRAYMLCWRLHAMVACLESRLRLRLQRLRGFKLGCESEGDVPRDSA